MTEQEHPDLTLETVFATSEADLVPVIKSVLEAAEIPYVTDGEAMMNLFPSDMLGPALHRSRGELRFQVAAERAEEARALLNDRTRLRNPEDRKAIDEAIEAQNPVEPTADDP